MAGAGGSSLDDVAGFLLRLKVAGIHHTLTTVREGAVMVQVTVPGERWEIEFFPDRPPEIEIFRSDGSIGGAELFDQLFNEHGECDPSPT
jgi:hypothetical protein